MSTSYIIPLGTLTDQSVNSSVTRIGLSSHKPSSLYTEYGRRFTLEPMSRSARFIL